MKLNRVGEIFITNQKLTCEIIEYKNNKDCTVRFNDGTIKHTTYDHLLTGNVKNLNHKCICGIGYVGEGKYKPSNKSVKTSIYNTWHSILQRCYDPIKQEKTPTYIGCSVAEEWHNFQNFAEWYEENYIEGFEIDKDLLIKGNKVYGPDTCCFLPPIINNNLLKINRKHYKDVQSRLTVYNKYRASIKLNRIYKHIGNYNTSEEAFNAYKEAKEENIKYLANLWKYKLSPNAYNALINYKIEL